MQTRRTLVTLALGALIGGAAWGQEPIEIIVPAGAGSAPDIIARIVGDELSTRLKRPVVVNNRPGAGGIIAVMAAKSASNPDTLLLAQAAVVTVTPLTYRAAKYDLETDMEPVVSVADTPMMFVANAEHGPKTLADALAAARKDPGAVALTTTSRGSIPHLTAELLVQTTGAPFNIVPTATTGQGIQTVVGGEAAMTVNGVAPLLPLVKSGRLKGLAVTSAKVLPGLEGYPLAKDIVPGLQATGWFMLFAKKGTPAARVQQINQIVNAALQSPAVVDKLARTANYPLGGSVADARAFLKQEKALWSGIVKNTDIHPE
ncbi:tripartite tricarboxylate transporter substrate binding protein [Ottowia sp.]|uniref:Bug family tripartite tricarboxylate transporter substrate binding protein n=1 Tax=Ottowia sp. TaxID=1898956 RepID=UPI0025EA18B9|nr:tripartite tricarboxylate transporter substrate binding protein [Ottowia sp.]